MHAPVIVQDPIPIFLSRTGESGFHDMEDYLKSFGPGLISGFEVEHKFVSDDWQHLGARKTNSKGHHAMVLVGIRKEVDNTRYLIQNWWERKAFVEVDGDYLNSCGATIYFVQTPQTVMGVIQPMRTTMLNAKCWMRRKLSILKCNLSRISNLNILVWGFSDEETGQQRSNYILP